MSTERTLSIIKPDATKRNITGKIISCFEESGLNIIAQKKILLTKERAEGFYSVHSDKPFFADLVNFMTSAPIIVQVLEGENAILKNREIMGATNPEEAEEGTIRKQFALSIEANSVHGSDSAETAIEEINYFFDESEIL
ncbi:MAG: nucleoside-diphosphate kinase [Pseudomonadota bacterium]|jgi:nucleoside-diphosphate kinase|nr:nucleoside-diphosphate kinase [Pseudomonadota bacterium]MEC9097855.1 nucleoside-diphosphate kinase [Pseudomonadota bacterium]MED5254455.1 nucleoside-diphosphate kinase [Pseudomonadota bacterium]MED5273346.1 nucleoside-diphosphate kinase [Pseudomonadota bacterium]MED5484970.1 nucleoside-diphosphate kinase [Pseudomonadota bacterium]|tara:strand:+ start:159 stop:578 length:420 start_codon:yes stop_codon:yes gene_type:complete